MSFWPPRSCNLTPLEKFLEGFVKAHVYTDKLASIDALEDNIEVFIRETSAEIFERKIGHGMPNGQFEAQSRSTFA